MSVDDLVYKPVPELLDALRELELRTRQFLNGTLVTFPAALLPQVRVAIARADALKVPGKPMPLTPEQAAEIRETARETVYEDCQQDRHYLGMIVDAYVDGQATDVDRAMLVCSDPDQWFEFWSFDPETGEPWPEENEAD